MIFNPDVPDVQPTNFLGWSKSIEQPKSDESGKYFGEANKIRLAGAGEALDTAVGIADTYMKEGIIKPDIRNQVDTVRDSFTAGLDATKQAFLTKAGVNSMPGSNPGGGGEDSQEDGAHSLAGTASQQSVPQGISNGLGIASKVQDALASKKISETYYYGQLNSISKDMRSRYPGYRDYIDQEISKITGVNPANKLMESIRDDIQHTAQALATNKDKIQTHLDANLGEPGIAAIANAHQNGTITSEYARLKLGEALSGKAIYEDKKREIELRGLTRKDEQQPNQETYYNRITKVASQAYEGALVGFGQNADMKIIDLVDKVQRGQITLSEPDALALQQKMHAVLMSTASYMRQDADTFEPGQRSMTNKMGGPEERDKLIGAALSDHRAIADAFASKDVGLALSSLRRATAIGHEDQIRLLEDPTVGSYVRMRNLLKGNGLPDVMLNDLDKRALASGVDKAVQNLSLEQYQQMRTQTNVSQPGAPVTANAQLDRAIKFKITDPTYFNSYLKQAKDIADPTVDRTTKENLATTFYNPLNLPLLDKIKSADYIDPATNRFVPGKYAAYNTLTGREITKEIVKLGPQFVADYKSTTETWFSTLFRDDMVKLGELQNTPGLQVRWSDGAKEQLGWKAYDSSGKPVVGPIKVRLDRINMALSNQGHIEESTGGNINAYLVELMKSNGLDTTKMYKAVESARPQEIKAGAERAIKAAPSVAKRAADYVFKEFVPELLNPTFGGDLPQKAPGSP